MADINLQRKRANLKSWQAGVHSKTALLFNKLGRGATTLEKPKMHRLIVCQSRHSPVGIACSQIGSPTKSSCEAHNPSPTQTCAQSSPMNCLSLTLWEEPGQTNISKTHQPVFLVGQPSKIKTVPLCDTFLVIQLSPVDSFMVHTQHLLQAPQGSITSQSSSCPQTTCTEERPGEDV